MSLIHYNLVLLDANSLELILNYPEKVRTDEVFPKDSIIKINNKNYIITDKVLINYDNKVVSQYLTLIN